MQHPLLWSRTVAVALAAALAAVGLQATLGLSPSAPPPAPAAVAVVDVTRISGALNEAKDLGVTQQKHFDDYQKQLDQAVADLKAAEADLKEAADKDTPDLYAKRTRYVEAKALATARRQSLGEARDVEIGATLAGLYKKVIAAVEKVAEEQGLDLVLLNDSPIVPGRDMTGDDMARLMAARKVLFARARLDITQEVITRMNNDYAALKKN